MIEFRSESIHVQVLAPETEISKSVLTSDALRFIGILCSTYEERRQALLVARKQKAILYDSGLLPHYIHNEHPAHDDVTWKCASIPIDIKDRRVEITGPVDRKMIINGLNSGATVYMADFEDSTSPTFYNIIDGQYNLRDAIRGDITYINPENNNKVYKLNNKTAVLMVRPRGWHLNEGHIIVNGKIASGSIVDFALYLFHNHSMLKEKKTGPYYYLPKIESYKEATLWNDIFITAQQYLGIPIGTIRATVLLETITAAFEMEEILYELKEHSIGLNCGRWDYLFSFIKKFKNHSNHITPDRSFLTMTTPLMDSYVKRLIYICHKRNTFAMGGMSAAIPIKNDIKANDIAIQKVRDDKIREVTAGHDGTWVAHPALVQVALDVFNQYMKTSNQITLKPSYVGKDITESDLLQLPTNIPKKVFTITNAHLAHGIGIVLAYTEAWLSGIGCIPLHNAMEDAATAEISRAQIWQWRHFNVITQDDQCIISSNRISTIIQQIVHEKTTTTTTTNNNNNKFALAGTLVEHMLTKENELDDFLTSVCYPHIMTTSDARSTSKL